MASLEPTEDPYVALGVPKDADISAIRAAHRKLVLKYHPDRIKNEAERAKGVAVFQKVQFAYELLSDPVQRARYDNRVKLERLREEIRVRDIPVRSASYPTRPPPSTPSREYRDGRFYEERVPAATYFDESPKYREDESRATSRKYDGYDRKSSTGHAEREKKSSKGDEKTPGGLSFNITMKMRARAAKAQEAVREKTKDKDARTANAKARDREQRRERSDKYSRTAFVESDSDSNSDTATYVTVNRLSRSPKASRDSPPRTKSKAQTPKKKPSNSRHEDEEEVDHDKWHGYYKGAQEHIVRSQPRAAMQRSESSSSYWTSQHERQPGKNSSSDNDRPRSSKGRRPSIDVQKTRPPPMASQKSAPAGVAAMRAPLDRKESATKQRTTSSSSSPRDTRKEVPQMNRSHTMPTARGRGDPVPARGSNLKHAETHDSGYGSSGGQTPEMRGSSPQRHTGTRYRVGDDDEVAPNPKKFFVDPEDRDHQTRSPSPQLWEKDRRDRPSRPTVKTDARPRSSKGATFSASPVDMERPAPSRYDPSRWEQQRGGSPRDSPPTSRHNSGWGKPYPEMEEREPQPYTYRVPTEKVSTSPRPSPQDVKWSPYDRRASVDEADRDHYPPSSHREQVKNPRVFGRRGSAY